MPLLELEKIGKRYLGVRALVAVDFDVDDGEVHALLGENGAGKSTLMKSMAGTVVPDTGRMTVRGVEVGFGSPEAAREHGIGIVYQELSLVPSLSVAENVLLGRYPTTSRLRLVDWKAMNEQASAHLERVGLGELDPRKPVAPLSMATRQLVEIAKALSGDTRVLLLDEPTSALSEPEADRLFATIAGLTASSVGVVYVSHRLAEVSRIAHRVTVLRDGARVGTLPRDQVAETELATMMVGREVRIDTHSRARAAGSSDVVLRAHGVARPPHLHPTDLELRRGEIVAVFGLVGSGRDRLARTLFGLDPATEGRVEVDDRETHIGSPAAASSLGIGYVAAGRSESLVPRMGLAPNLTLGALDRVTRGPLLDLRAERELARRYLEELNIKARSLAQAGETLSGGNQQKVILARWLAAGSRLLILDDPTRGIDIGAKEEVFRILHRLATAGIAILYLTSEIREAQVLASRVLVMAAGRVVDEVTPDTPQSRIMAAAGGSRA
ncbi:MAG: sugar ABC transporter ATP-binding protein [Streptosporangiales bacterium]